MDFSYFLDIFLHLDTHLSILMQQYGTTVYIFLFLVIFCETGLVITPFLPGDSLIFAAGALAATGIMGWGTLPLLITAAITGNMLNYQIGRFLNRRIKRGGKIHLVRQDYLDRTQKFFDRHGGATIIITRFMPILRTFSPFVAGLGKMPYRRFFIFNAIGGTAWAFSFFLIGYFFGNLPLVKTHFSVIVVGIVCISVIPALIAFLKGRKAHENSGEEEESA